MLPRRHTLDSGLRPPRSGHRCVTHFTLSSPINEAGWRALRGPLHFDRTNRATVSRSLRSPLAGLALYAGLGLAPLNPGAGQGTAGITGQLLDRSSGQPVGGALVIVLGMAPSLRSDSGGRFHRPGLAAGTYVLQVRALGYTPTSRIVVVADRETAALRLDLEPAAVAVAGVTIEGARYYPRGMRGFEERRKRGRGVYVTEAHIKEKGARQLGDLLRTVPGVREVCRRGICRVRMARGECPPNFFVDGFPANNSTTLELPVIGIVGVEIYPTVTETPPEFLRGVTVCGAIAIWTRITP